MSWIIKWRYFSIFTKILCRTVTGASSFYGAYTAYCAFNNSANPALTIWEMLTSTTAVIVYILGIIALICLYINEKFKNLDLENVRLNQKVEELNMELNAATARLDSAMRNGKIATFKNKFFLTTEKLYIDLAEKIHNDISISYMSIHNTIEDSGIGDKKDSCIKLFIQGVALNRVSQIHILSAGDTIVKWDDIRFEAYEVKNSERIRLNARLADNGQDSYLKQVVISYDNIKKSGDVINLLIYWKWPNMLNVVSEDYTTLPIVLSQTTSQIEMSIEPMLPIKFKEVGIYKYAIGMQEAELIMDLKPDKNNRLSYRDESPEFKTCFILYYKVENDKKVI